jgi:PST family polysaccharide transporter
MPADVAESPPTATRRVVQADTLAASVVILLIATVVQRTVGFGRSVLYCSWLSPDALGQWEMVYSFLMLAAPLAVLGVPGSFGRYAEHYRQRGHLRTFLHRAALWTGACTAAALVLIECFAPELSTLLFGLPDDAALVRGIGICLASVILHHTLTALLAGLRLYRIVSAMNFAQSLLFAGISLGLMWREPNVANIVIGYSIACVIASIGAIIWAWPALIHLEPAPDALPHGAFWAKLLRFAFFVWVSNLLAQLFAVVDRYMLVHCAGLSPAEALVGRRINTAVKLMSLGSLAAGACILAVAPFLFHVVLEGRYDEGLQVLPWTLAGCVWYGIYTIAQNYLWCAERARLATAPLALGLIVNVALNFALLPSMGLHGAVIATAASTALCLVAVILFSARHGMHVARGTWLIVMAPASIGFGTDIALATCSILVIASCATNVVFTADERRELAVAASDQLTSKIPLVNRRRAAAP